MKGALKEGQSASRGCHGEAHCEKKATERLEGGIPLSCSGNVEGQCNYSSVSWDGQGREGLGYAQPLRSGT